jgi:5-methylcytosine-specific restriction endonuclease McrA
MGIRHEGRARRLGLPWEAIDLRLMYKHHKGVCGVCAQPVEFDVFTVDHIVAITNGGGHVWENLQVAHKDCNSRKGTKG